MGPWRGSDYWRCRLLRIGTSQVTSHDRPKRVSTSNASCDSTPTSHFTCATSITVGAEIAGMFQLGQTVWQFRFHMPSDSSQLFFFPVFTPFGLAVRASHLPGGSAVD